MRKSLSFYGLSYGGLSYGVFVSVASASCENKIVIFFFLFKFAPLQQHERHFPFDFFGAFF
jgi:hypothetical protein